MRAHSLKCSSQDPSCFHQAACDCDPMVAMRGVVTIFWYERLAVWIIRRLHPGWFWNHKMMNLPGEGLWCVECLKFYAEGGR